MFIFCVANQKGGVGKTATADALAAYVSRQYGYKVLAIDLDPQCNLTAAYGLNPYDKGLNVRDVLLGACEANQAIHKTRGAILRGSMLMTGLEEALQTPDKHLALQKALKPLEGVFDCAVIDTPPGVGLGTTNALFAADMVLIPTEASMFALQGVQELLKNVRHVQKYRPELRAGGIILTRYTPRSNIAQYAAAEIRKTATGLGVQVFGAFVRECSAVKEAAAMSQSIFDYAKKSNAAKDYEAVFNELFEAIRKEEQQL